MPRKKVTNEEIVKLLVTDTISVRSVDKIWKTVVKDALIVIISVALGASITYYFNIKIENDKETELRNSIATIFYIDILNNVLTQYVKFNHIVDKDIYKKVLENNEMIQTTEVTSVVFDSYINHLLMFNHLVAARIIAFYGDLKHMKTAIETINRGSRSLEKGVKQFWINFIEDKMCSAIRKGKWIMSRFEKTYNIGELKQNKMAKEGLEKLHQRLILKRPDLKDKLDINE